MAVAPYNTDIYSAFAFLGLVVVLIPLKWNVLSASTQSSRIRPSV